MLSFSKQSMWMRVLAFFALLSFLVAAGCAPAGSNDSASPEDNQAEQVKIVTDFLGRDVEVPVEVNRIAALYAYSGHVTTMLGRGNDVVAIVNGLSRDVLLNKICPSIGQCPIPFNHDSINIEELVKLEPDLVLLKGDVGNNDAEVAKLNKFGIPYVVVDCNSIEEQMRSIEVIGQALDREEKAQQYNDYYQECIDRVQKVVANIPEDERVRVFHSVNEANRTDSAGTLPADWLGKVGIINVSVEEELRLVDGKYFASIEQILLWDPDVIIANEDGVPEYILNDAKWAPLKAVKDKKVYQMPVGIARWGHPGGMETPLAILWTAKTIYPAYFQDLDIEAEAKDFYKTFFNFEVSDELMERIMTATDMRKAKNERPVKK